MLDWQNLARNAIGDAGAQAICNMLHNNVVIDNLDLSCMYSNNTIQLSFITISDVRILFFNRIKSNNRPLFEISNRIQWRNYERRREAIASGRQAAGGARGRFWSTDCLLYTTELSRISKERKKLKNKQNDRNLVYLYSFRTMKVHL